MCLCASVLVNEACVFSYHRTHVENNIGCYDYVNFLLHSLFTFTSLSPPHSYYSVKIKTFKVNLLNLSIGTYF